MKTYRNDLGRQARLRRTRGGIALISVLAVLVLLTLLVVAFMTRATVSRSAASSFRATTATKVLADTAVGLVQAQINEATGSTVPTGGAAVTKSWASQPGAIRVFQSSTTSHDNLNTYGGLVNIFRLYSNPAKTAQNVTAFASDLPASLAVMSNQPATWVDLNAPSVDAQGASHYPILDVRSPVDPTQPIVIPGFSISSNTSSLVSTSPPAVPMPVQWLYVLKDGSVIPPTSTANAVLTFNGKDPSGNTVAMPTVQNPIVGRVGYWTDDDSCKVNINTAAGDDVVHAVAQDSTTSTYANTSGADSIFWSTPMFVSTDDYKLSRFQPARGEFQRYSGHPGTVGLSSLLSALCGLTVPLDATDTTHNPFYSLTPRYAQGGSLSNTQPISAVNTGSVQDGEGNWSAIDLANIPESNNRLYTSVAEMLFSPGPLTASDRPFSTLATTAKADSTQTNAAGVVERANFFLSAHSSAPELNLWSEPRVSIWPQNTNTAFRSTEDQLIAFDSTVRTTGGLEPYFFQRSDPTSTTEWSLPISGTYISGNSQVLTYLDTLTTMTAIPGFGSGFTSKYVNTGSPPQMRQILAEVFDYVRTVNVRDPNFPVADSNSHSQGRYGIPWSPAYTNGTHDGLVQIVPSAGNTASGSDPTVLGSGLMGWGAQGNASFPVLIEASLQFVAMGVGQFSYQAPTVSGVTPPPITYREIPVPPPQFQAVGSYPTPQVAYDVSPTSGPPSVANPTFYGDVIYPEGSATPNQLATTDDCTISGGKYSMSGDVISNTTGKGAAGYPYGRPADGTTAMQAFLLLTFLNPALCNDVSNPAFCVSVKGLNSLVIGSLGNNTNGYTGSPPHAVASSQSIVMRFPGTVNNGSPAQENTAPYSRMVFNTDMLGTYVGSTCVGYIPWLFETGCQGYEWYTQTALGPSDTIWNSDGQGALKHCPFYSQLFCVGGVGTPTDNPATAPGSGSEPSGGTYTPSYATASTFSINAVPLQIFINTAHTSLKTLNAPSVQEFDVTFVASAFKIPSIPTTAGRIIGTGTYFGTWDIGGHVGNPAHHKLGGTDTTAKLFFLPDIDDRWCIPYTSYYGNGDYGYGGAAGCMAPSTSTSCADATNTWNFDAAHDVIQSMVLSSTWSDARDLAVSHVPATAYQKHPVYGAAYSNMANNLWWDNWDTTQGCTAFYPVVSPAFLGQLVPNVTYHADVGNHLLDLGYPIVPPPATTSQEMGSKFGAYTTTSPLGSGPGDWDNGLGNQTDGPWVNMADDGSVPTVGNVDGIYGTMLAYFQVGNGFSTTQVVTFSPDRMLPSPVMLGSLPTGVNSTIPHAWQTLLFQPGTNAVGTAVFNNHPGQKGMTGYTLTNTITAGLPPDHLLLDLFWMPEAEPYPISQPFSTAGKINLNYEIEPFSYIVRATALRALFASEKVALMPAGLSGGNGYWDINYKGGLTSRNQSDLTNFTNNVIVYTGGANSPDDGGETRLPVDPDATLGLNFSRTKTPRHLNQAGTSSGDTYNVNPTNSDFDSTDDPHPSAAAIPTSNGAVQSGVSAWYASTNNDGVTNTGTRFFKSASEICEMFLVPQGYSWAQFAGFPKTPYWGSHSWYYQPTSSAVATGNAGGDFAMVGDNARERPYSDLYSRLTTKSNVFTVYYTVQALRNAEPKVDNSPLGADQQHWDENKGNVLGESRGSTIIERYLDPNEAMPDCLSTLNAGHVSLESYYKWRIVETRQFAP